MATTTIEWTNTYNQAGEIIRKGKTWNPTTGCNKISEGCRNCYAEVMHKRLQAMGQPKYEKDFKHVVTHESELYRPDQWKKPANIFVNSMSDLFHKDVPVQWIKKVFTTMNENPQHTFMILTKRADRLATLSSELNWSPNIWMGVSVENQEATKRIDYLRKTGAPIKFLSIEPLLEDLPDLNLEGIDWVIAGGESGTKARPVQKEWIINIRDQCQKQNVKFFFKQWGGRNKKESGRVLDGRTWEEFPDNYNFEGV